MQYDNKSELCVPRNLSVSSHIVTEMPILIILPWRNIIDQKKRLAQPYFHFACERLGYPMLYFK